MDRYAEDNRFAGFATPELPEPRLSSRIMLGGGESATKLVPVGPATPSCFGSCVAVLTITANGLQSQLPLEAPTAHKKTPRTVLRTFPGGVMIWSGTLLFATLRTPARVAFDRFVGFLFGKLRLA